MEGRSHLPHNFLRSCLRDFGISIPIGAQRAIQTVRDALSNIDNPVPVLLHSSLLELLTEIAALGERCKHVDLELARLTEHDSVFER